MENPLCVRQGNNILCLCYAKQLPNNENTEGWEDSPVSKTAHCVSVRPELDAPVPTRKPNILSLCLESQHTYKALGNRNRGLPRSPGSSLPDACSRKPTTRALLKVGGEDWHVKLSLDHCKHATARASLHSHTRMYTHMNTAAQGSKTFAKHEVFWNSRYEPSWGFSKMFTV